MTQFKSFDSVHGGQRYTGIIIAEGTTLSSTPAVNGTINVLFDSKEKGSFGMTGLEPEVFDVLQNIEGSIVELTSRIAGLGMKPELGAAIASVALRCSLENPSLLEDIVGYAMGRYSVAVNGDPEKVHRLACALMVLASNPDVINGISSRAGLSADAVPSEAMKEALDTYFARHEVVATPTGNISHSDIKRMTGTGDQH